MRRISKSYTHLLLVGFGAMLLIMLGLVSASLIAMDKTRSHLNRVVDDHMVKVSLSKKMRTAARNRTLILFQLIHIEDPFERDEEWMLFNQMAGDFITARNAILNMPLADVERMLLEEQGEMSRIAIPIQERIVELINSDEIEEANFILNAEAVPAQADVLAIVDQFDAYQLVQVRAAQEEALANMEKMRRVSMVLGLVALFTGGIVALVVMRVIKQRTEIDIYHATHDALTELPNRALLMERLKQSLRHAKRSNKAVALMFVDVDHFKAINDTYGHATGDKALLTVCDRIKSQLRESDTLARLSGDEFVVLMENIGDHDDITKVADRIIAAFNQPAQIDGNAVNIGVSIGISHSPEHGNTPDTLLSHADTAMYESKEMGRNSWSISQAD